MLLFNESSNQEITETTLRYAQDSKVWRKKNDPNSNLYKFFDGFSTSQNEYISGLNTIFLSSFPRESTDALDRHEEDLNIPDGTFNKEGTLEDRQIDVIVKKYMMRGNRAQDYIDIAAMYGVTIEILPLIEHAIFPLLFPIVFSSSAMDARFTLVIVFKNQLDNIFPLPFPVPFAATSNIEKLKRIFNTIKPATTKIIYQTETI